MVLLHPDRIAAAWLRSGVPPVKAAENKPEARYSPGERYAKVYEPGTIPESAELLEQLRKL